MTLADLARGSASLERLDEWGDGLLRATIRYEGDGRQRTVALLLVEKDDRFYWAATN